MVRRWARELHRDHKLIAVLASDLTHDLELLDPFDRARGEQARALKSDFGLETALFVSERKDDVCRT